MDFHEKIIPLDQLAAWRKGLAESGFRLVVTNGCFDVLHVGHVRYLEAARDLGDVLLVGLNSDESVRSLKGPTRPVNPETDRAIVLAALQCVNAVCVFPEVTATRFLELARPDVYAKGGDYTIETIPTAERAGVEQAGGTIQFLPFIPGKSTTGIIQRLSAE